MSTLATLNGCEARESEDEATLGDEGEYHL